jgi:hypothetical protein
VRPAARDLVGGGSVGTLSGGVGRISERRQHEPQGGGAGPLGGAGPPGGGCGNGVMSVRRMKTVAAVRNLEPEKNRYRLYPSVAYIHRCYRQVVPINPAFHLFVGSATSSMIWLNR